MFRGQQHQRIYLNQENSECTLTTNHVFRKTFVNDMFS